MLRLPAIQFFKDVAGDANGPKALALELTNAGYEVGEAAVRTWMRGKHEPPLKAVLWLARRYGRSLNHYAFGEQAPPGLAETVREHERRLDEIETSMIEFASRGAQDFGAPAESDDVPNLAYVRLRRDLDELRRTVERLAGEQA